MDTKDVKDSTSPAERLLPRGPVRYAAMALVGAAFVAVLYSQVLHAPFFYDDLQNIRDNPYVRLTTLSFQAIRDAAFRNIAPTRPVSNLSFGLNYYVHGYHIFGYHIVNIVIHMLAGLFLFLFMRDTVALVKHKSMSPLVTERTDPDIVAFAAAFIWLIHPLQIQSVTYIVQRMNSMAGMFFFLSMLCYARARLAAGTRRQWALFALCGVSGLLALGSKEMTATLPFFILLYEWYFIQDLDFNWFKRRSLVVAGVVLALAVLVVVFIGKNPIEGLAAAYKYRDFTMAQRVMSEFRIVLMYLTLVFLPLPGRLTLDYDFPLSYSLLNPPTTLVSLVVIVALVGLGIAAARRDRLLSYGILWYFGNLVIESSVIGLELVYEHRTYIPMVFVVLLTVLAAHRYLKPWQARVAAFIAVAAVLSLWTWQRNLVWKDEMTLWDDCVRKAPNKVRTVNNYGLALLEAGQVDKAIVMLGRAVEMKPEPGTLNNLGNALVTQGRFREAIPYYTRALETAPDFVNARLGLGNAYDLMGSPEMAVREFQVALALNPRSDAVHTYLGRAFIKLKDYDQAVRHFREALRWNPSSFDAYASLGNVSTIEGRYGEAKGYYLQALKVNPGYADAYNNLGHVLFKERRYAEAVDAFNHALRLNPGLAKSHENLGMLYAQRGDYESAVLHLQEALRLQPGNYNVQASLQEALATKQKVEEGFARVGAALQADPENPVLLFQMAGLHRAKGDIGNAVSLYERALAIRPAFPQALQGLAVAHTAGGDYDSALDTLKRLIALNPGNPEPYYNTACVHALRGDAKEAVAWLRKAVEKGFSDWNLIETDDDLAGIRASREFQDFAKGR